MNSKTHTCADDMQINENGKHTFLGHTWETFSLIKRPKTHKNTSPYTSPHKKLLPHNLLKYTLKTCYRPSYFVLHTQTSSHPYKIYMNSLPPSRTVTLRHDPPPSFLKKKTYLEKTHKNNS